MNTVFNSLQSLLALAGRILIALYFVPAGFSKLSGGFSGAVSYSASVGLPFPVLSVTLATALEIGVGLAFLFGFMTRLGALSLAIFTVIAALFFHNYWAMPANMQMIQSIMFWNHLALVGGLLAFTAFGAGRLSVDHIFMRRTQK